MTLIFFTEQESDLSESEFQHYRDEPESTKRNRNRTSKEKNRKRNSKNIARSSQGRVQQENHDEKNLETINKKLNRKVYSLEKEIVLLKRKLKSQPK